MKDSINTSINSISFCICEKCMQQTGRLDLSAILTSSPPKYRYVCDNCGNIGFISTYTVSSTGVSTSANDDASVTASSECDTCVHKNTCKYHDTLLEYSKNLKKLELPEFLSCTLICKYKQTRSAYSLLGNTKDITKEWEDSKWSDRTLPNLPETAHPCSTCDFYINNIGKLYIGDAPCDYCSKNPYKVTCGTNISSNSLINQINATPEDNSKNEKGI